MKTTRHPPPAERVEPPEPDHGADLVAKYLSQIAAIPLLTAGEEVALAKRIEAGVYAAHLLTEHEAVGGRPHDRRALETIAEDGQRAKDQLIRANLRLVAAEAKRHARQSMPYLDVVQEGNLGLMHAVEKFDYTKGYKFSTYAMWWIRQSIRRGMAQRARAIRLPNRQVEELTRLARCEEHLRARLGEEPSVDELAQAAGITAAKVTELRALAHISLSLDTPVGDDGEATVGDLIPDTDVLQALDVVEYHELAREIRILVDTLPPRESLILSLRYGLQTGQPATVQEVAARVGLSADRVRQLEKQALKELRDPERVEPALSSVS
ncbi:sigma-70 family RNA polymerase sigma factor [Saccharopolyspora sp. NPDC000995]